MHSLNVVASFLRWVQFIYLLKINPSIKMKTRISLFLTFLFATFSGNAQQNTLKVNQHIVLPKDTTESKLLISSLNEFLISAQKPNEENKYVLETEKVETFLLLDEIKDIEKSGKFKDDYFYKPYLTNVVALRDNQYIIQVSFIGTNENVAMLRTSFEFIAHKNENGFLFASPLLRNTRNWKIEKVGNNIFHYQTTINKSKVQEFNKLTSVFDKKLNATNKITEYYLCEDLIELAKLIGMEYKSDYNGIAESATSSSLGDKKVVVFGNNNTSFDAFDPHDLWHDRLSLVIPRSQVNKPVDEGCAYLYGGSWGITWKDIFKEFKGQIASNKNANWMDIKENPVYFRTKEFNNSADYIVNALLVQKIEKEKGFAGVWELLNSGKYEKGNENYYKALEKLTGITKTNYNDKIWELINSEK
jgi:hypothetical protein